MIRKHILGIIWQRSEMIIEYNFQNKRQQKEHIYFIDSICLGPSCFCFPVQRTKGLFSALHLPASCSLNLLNHDSFSFTQQICWTQLGFPFLSQYSGKMLLNGNIWKLQIELIRASLVSQQLKNLSEIQKTWDQSLGWKGSREEGMTTHFSILAWKNHGQMSLIGYSP